MIVVCPVCKLGLRILGSNSELWNLVGPNSDFWPDKFPCPGCDAMAVGMDEREADPAAIHHLELKDLTAQEAFAAFNGLGLPEERIATMDVVTGLLREHPIRKVRGTEVANRFVIDHLELWDGTKLYFGASTEGALIYRITRPVSYTKKVLDESR